jgi:hypothetical protein
VKVHFCARCIPDAEQWDREHSPLVFEQIKDSIFCRSCAEVLKKRLEERVSEAVPL